MGLAAVIDMVEKFRASGALFTDGGVFRVCWDAALEEGFRLSVTRNRKVAMKKDQRTPGARRRRIPDVQTFAGPVSALSTTDQLNGWFKKLYGDWPWESDQSMREAGGDLGLKYDFARALGLWSPEPSYRMPLDQGLEGARLIGAPLAEPIVLDGGGE